MALRLTKGKMHFLKLVSFKYDKEFTSSSGTKTQYQTVWEDDKTEQYYGEYVVPYGTPVDDIFVGKKYTVEVTFEGKHTDTIRIIGVEQPQDVPAKATTSEIPKQNALTFDALMGYRRSCLNLAQGIMIRQMDLDTPVMTMAMEEEMYEMSERMLSYMQTGKIPFPTHNKDNKKDDTPF